MSDEQFMAIDAAEELISVIKETTGQELDLGDMMKILPRLEEGRKLARFLSRHLTLAE